MTEPAPGDLLDLDVTGIAHGGVFVARHEGRVVFVADAIPGERVRARLSDASKKAFWRAETVEVLDASPHRRPHVWAEADVHRAPEQRPGGADLGHIEIGHQRALKRRVLSEALDRFAGGGMEAPEVEDAGLASEGWRTRTTLHVDGDGRVGPYAARSHRIVPVDDHPLATPGVAAAARALTGGAEGEIDLVQPADGDVRRILRPTAPRRARTGRRPQGRSAPRRAPETIEERVGDRVFRLDDDGFWQVHAQAAGILDGAVADLLRDRIDPEALHLDLYGGVGLFAATLGDLGARRIVTVESSPRATLHAAENLRDLGAEAVTARVDRYLAGSDAPTGGVGAVVLDPPRAGAGREVVEAVTRLDPQAVVYVACDPVALARDLGTFREQGFAPQGMRAFDLFPHSHHLESVVLLTR